MVINMLIQYFIVIITVRIDTKNKEKEAISRIALCTANLKL